MPGVPPSSPPPLGSDDEDDFGDFNEVVDNANDQNTDELFSPTSMSPPDFSPQIHSLDVQLKDNIFADNTPFEKKVFTSDEGDANYKKTPDSNEFWGFQSSDGVSLKDWTHQTSESNNVECPVTKTKESKTEEGNEMSLESNHQHDEVNINQAETPRLHDTSFIPDFSSGPRTPLELTTPSPVKLSGSGEFSAVFAWDDEDGQQVKSDEEPVESEEDLNKCDEQPEKHEEETVKPTEETNITDKEEIEKSTLNPTEDLGTTHKSVLEENVETKAAIPSFLTQNTTGMESVFSWDDLSVTENDNDDSGEFADFSASWPLSNFQKAKDLSEPSEADTETPQGDMLVGDTTVQNVAIVTNETSKNNINNFKPDFTSLNTQEISQNVLISETTEDSSATSDPDTNNQDYSENSTEESRNFESNSADIRDEDTSGFPISGIKTDKCDENLSRTNDNSDNTAVFSGDNFDTKPDFRLTSNVEPNDDDGFANFGTVESDNFGSFGEVENDSNSDNFANFGPVENGSSSDNDFADFGAVQSNSNSEEFANFEGSNINNAAVNSDEIKDKVDDPDPNLKKENIPSDVDDFDEFEAAESELPNDGVQAAEGEPSDDDFDDFADFEATAVQKQPSNKNMSLNEILGVCFVEQGKVLTVAKQITFFNSARMLTKTVDKEDHGHAMGTKWESSLAFNQLVNRLCLTTAPATSTKKTMIEPLNDVFDVFGSVEGGEASNPMALLPDDLKNIQEPTFKQNPTQKHVDILSAYDKHNKPNKELSKEALAILDSLPNLNFMLSPVLMFPVKG